MEGKWILVCRKKKNRDERKKKRDKSNVVKCGFCYNGFHSENVICRRYLMSDSEWLSFNRYYSDIMEGKDEWLKNKVREWYFPLV